MPTLTIDGATVVFSDTGAPDGRPDAPVVVFGHGLLFGGWMFRAQIEALRDTHRCIAIDWRGQGDSPPAASGYDMDTLAGDAAAVIERVAGGPVHYVGLSMGGFVGQRIAARRPELVRSLVLLDTSAAPEEPVAAVKDRLLAVVYRRIGIGPVRGPVERQMFGPVFRRDPQGRRVIGEWATRLARCDRDGIRRAVLGVVDRAGVTDEVPRITAPTLVIVGADDRPTPPRRARQLAGLIPGARLEIVPACGHSSTVEQPGTVTSLITSFLAEVEASPERPAAAERPASD